MKVRLLHYRILLPWIKWNVHYHLINFTFCLCSWYVLGKSCFRHATHEVYLVCLLFGRLWKVCSFGELNWSCRANCHPNCFVYYKSNYLINSVVEFMAIQISYYAPLKRVCASFFPFSYFGISLASYLIEIEIKLARATRAYQWPRGRKFFRFSLYRKTNQFGAHKKCNRIACTNVTK